jgi:mono/diheme cytochrome c family protein
MKISAFGVFASTLATFTLTSHAESGPVDFTSQIKPLLESQCVSCHNPEKTKGKLLMDTAEGLMKGGEGGVSIVAGQPDKSPVYSRVILPEDHDDHMPPKGALKPEQAELLKRWIAEGAKWPQGLVLKAKSEEEQQADARLASKLNRIKSIEVLPANFNLETLRDRHRVMVFAKFDDDTTRDVTASATLQVANPQLASIENLALKPLQDGDTELVVTFQGQTVKAPIKVKDAAKDRAVSFNLDVMPVFMKAGCNSGGCHGSARGKDGFRLSLFGFDPEGDYNRVTREMSGRRVNLSIPEESTLIEKSLGAVPHSGNQCFEEGGALHKTLVEWIANGVPKDAPEVAKVTGIEVYPKQCVMEGKGERQQVTVRASYSDGTDRDVTHLAVFMSNNDPSASVDKAGIVSSHSQGEAFILARFSTFSKVSQFIVIPENLKYERPKLAENNYIDTLVHDKLHKLRILPSDICSDQEFLRRASVDIVGMLPTPDEVRSFVADANPKKRESLVDKLLGRKEFTEIWVMKWAELLQMQSTENNDGAYYKNVLLYYNWLADRIGKNVPMNEIVYQLLASEGGTIANPPTNYYQIERETLKVTENVAQVFMGMRIQCAQCHNHPFDQWTLDDYFGFKAFFTQIGRKQTDDPRETIVFNSKGGESKHPVTDAAVKPKFLGGATPEIKPGEDRREVMAKWLASPENPYFARNLANITWSHFFGMGIIDPVDDVRVSNPPSNPELIDALGNKLTEYNYDFKKLVRDICNSIAYQRDTQVNESNASDKRNFAKGLVRRLRAEILADAVSSVTNTPTKYQGLPLGARAVQIADGSVSNFFLKTFGRASRETVCSCEVKMDPTLSQALHFMNGDAAHENIKRGRVVADMIEKEKKTDQQIIEELYLRCFARQPLPKEQEVVLKQIAESPDGRQPVLEDLFWALINSKEFYFNH